ncbi:MAG TPA: hypothetical protein VKR61_14255 [Bryobacteraceae bacterium]|nr:hypothetical protein [Bryobacteraceae bacterium]
MNLGETDNDDPIERLRAGARVYRRPEKQPDCPDEDRLRMLVPGLLDHGEADELLSHAAECDWCGTVLREAVQDLAEPATAEEQEMAGKARLANARNRRSLARRLAPPEGLFQQIAGGLALWWRRAAVGLVAAAAVGGACYQFAWVGSTTATARLLAQAYSEKRSMEMRLPGASYSQVHVERGTERSLFSASNPLAEAVPYIKHGTEAHPDDPNWLHLEGTADLIAGDYDKAIPELERARSLRPTDTGILTDLGAAYFQKAEAEKSEDSKYYQLAFEALSKGVRLNNEDATLAFDYALAAERISVVHVAREAWETYLRLDSTSPWAAEARQHLNDLKKNSTSSGSTPNAQPQRP